MIAGQRPKPARLRLVEGNPGHRPVNKAEPRSPALKGPPRHLTDEQRSAWRELVRAAPEHVLQQADRFLLELAARLLVQARSTPEISAPLATQLRQCLGELGLSPSARTRLSVAPPAPANPFENL